MKPRLVEGAERYMVLGGVAWTPDVPRFCPLCGRPLEARSWTTTNERHRYRYLCCYGGSRLARLSHWLFGATWPDSAHYEYRFGEEPTPGAVPAYDRHSGEPL